MFATLRLPFWLAPRRDGRDGGLGRGRRRAATVSDQRSSSVTDPDAPLLARLRAGEADALTALVERHFSRLADIALVYVGTHDLAQEVAQDVMVALWEGRNRLTIEHNLAHYLNRAARNRALRLSEVRTREARQQASIIAETIDQASVPNFGDIVIESHEFRAAVDTILATLQPRVREIFLLYHEQGMRSGDIASLLGIAPATVYNQLSRALKALAAGLAGWRD